MGRDAILRILSQGGCEGIRFYLSQAHDANGDVLDNTIGLVAVGVDADVRDLGTGEARTILALTAASGNLYCSDCNPPHTSETLVALSNNQIPPNWDPAVIPTTNIRPNLEAHSQFASALREAIGI